MTTGQTFETALAERAERMLDACTLCGKCYEVCPIVDAAGAVLEDWVGDGGRVVEFGTRFTSMVVVPRDGADLEVAGTVKSLDEDARRATVELTVTAAGTKALGRCLAVVALA